MFIFQILAFFFTAIIRIIHLHIATLPGRIKYVRSGMLAPIEFVVQLIINYAWQATLNRASQKALALVSLFFTWKW